MKFTSISNFMTSQIRQRLSFRTNEIYKYLKPNWESTLEVFSFRTNEIYKYLKLG